MGWKPIFVTRVFPTSTTINRYLSIAIMKKNTSDPVGTLTVGNVVSASTTLYKSNFKRYFQVSLRAVGWLLAIGLSVVAPVFLGAVLFGLTNSWLLVFPLVVAWIAFVLYCSAKCSTNRGVISRLAYQDLINQPETITAATSALAPRTWGFFRLSWLVGFCLALVTIVGYLVFALVIGFSAWMLTILNLVANPLVMVLAVLVAIALFCYWIFSIIRYYSYWFVAELPMAVESTNSASVSMRRSRELSNAMVGRLQLIIFIAFLITIPISMIANLPSIVGQVMASPALNPTEAAKLTGNTLVAVGSLLGLASELFIMPFWQVIKAVIYYDLRNRREGSDLVI